MNGGLSRSVEEEPVLKVNTTLTDQGQGEWTLTVTELVGTDLTQQPSEDIRLAGPWVFRFRVP